MARVSKAAMPVSVLIVDDEKNMRHTMAAILREEGYRVATASTGEEAVDLCSRDHFDVVLMDVRMPGIDGVEAFRRIREGRKASRVILMSAYTQDALKQEALDEGATAFLAKPLDLEKVLRLISEVEDAVILVVENDEDTVSVLSTELRRHGYRVTATGSARHAMELVEQIHFDIAFVGVNLPAMNGLELYLAMKEAAPSTVAVMITEMHGGFEAAARQAVQCNAYAVVKKPLDMDHVLGLLERIAVDRSSSALRKPGLEDPQPPRQTS